MKRRIFLMLPVLALAATLAGIGIASGGDDPYTNVAANTKAAGFAPSSLLSPELRQTIVAQGSTALENPQGAVGWYGYINTAPSPDNPALPQMVPATTPPSRRRRRSPTRTRTSC